MFVSPIMECPKGQICDGTSNFQCEADRYLVNNECTACPKGNVCNGVKAYSCKADEYIENNACKSCGDTLQFQGYVCNGVTKTACNKDKFVYNNECIECPSEQVVNGVCNCGKTNLPSSCSGSPDNCAAFMSGSLKNIKNTTITVKGVPDAGCFTEQCCIAGCSTPQSKDSCQFSPPVIF